MTVAVIQYNAGNIQSVRYALERMGVDFQVTGNPDEIAKADKVIFPGVGEASTTMEFLKVNHLDKVIKELKQPVLGICLGMQLLCRHSEENDTPCLGVFEQSVVRFKASGAIKVPHMGWNSLTKVTNWLSGELEDQFVYFVHSFYVPPNEYTTSITEYGIPFSAAIRKNNFYAVQFHPEKSADAGEIVLQNFLSQ
jgi:imidazole glycerol-phosphate synthase subunit HisH